MFGRKFFVFLLLAAFDYAVAFICVSFGFFVRYLEESGFNFENASMLLYQKTWFFTVFAAFFVFLFYLRGIYRKRVGFWDETKEIAKASFSAVVIFFFATAIFKIEHSLSRTALLAGVLLSAVSIPILKLWLKQKLHSLGVWSERAVVIGKDERAQKLAENFENDGYLGYKIVGFLRSMDDYGYFSNQKIETVVVACQNIGEKELTALQKVVKNVILAPDIKGVAVLNTEFHYSFDERTFFLAIKNNLKSETNIFLKRALDVALSILLLPILVFVISALYLLIKLDSKGAAIFTQKRLGKDGEEFLVYKFRSMRDNADDILKEYLAKDEEVQKEWYIYKKIKGEDPRVTKIGKYLRASSLDELPQIFNVLKGEMSIVGPRPYLPSEKAEMGDKREYILESKPGITGLWQVSGRNELTFDERLNMDVWYTLNWSIWLDFVILLKTVKAVVKKSGAY